MERGLLWASVVIGIIVFLARFASSRRESPAAGASPETGTWNFPLAVLALAAPLLFLLTLPTHGAFFHPGGMFGVGYLIGGCGAVIHFASLIRRVGGVRVLAPPPSAIGVASAIGLSAVLSGGTQLFLRASLLDALLGVAIGWFCVTLAWYLALPSDERGKETAQQWAAGAGAATAICAAAVFGTLRDGITPEIAKGTWGGALTVFAAFGALLVAGTSLLPVGGARKWARSLPYLILLLGAGAGLYLLTQKYALDLKFAYAGIAGLLALGVGYWALGDRTGFGQTAWAVSMSLIAAGFTASAQALQGVGASAFVLAVWLAYAATSTIDKSEARSRVSLWDAEALHLPLFATSLLLFRLFTTRWESDLRGVGLTDSYALFGFLIGGFLPGLLAGASGVGRKGWGGAAGLAAAAALTAAVPAAVILLFGAKAASALMVGLAAGRVIVAPRGGVLAALLAIGAGLALVQFFGTILPPEEWTRLEKLKGLGAIVAVGAAALAATSFFGDKTGGAGHQAGDKEEA